MRLPDSDAEARYRDGVAAWIARDLVGALVTLSEALELCADDPEARWRPAIEHAMAQIAMEQDDLGRAAWHLRHFSPDDISIAQHLALRARRALLAGDPDGATRQAAAALWVVRDSAEIDDLGWWMNGAIALVWTADVLVELGFAADALTATGMVHDRIARAGHFDASVETMCALAEAGALQVGGDAVGARAALQRVDLGRDVDVPILVERLHARLARAAGAEQEARRRYGSAIAACEGTGHDSLRRLLLEELDRSPPEPRQQSLQEWVGAHGMDLPADAGAYALVLHVPVADPDACFALEGSITAALEQRPHLGVVDGEGTDGSDFDIYLEGPDPQALLDVVRPLVEAAGLAPRACVTIRDAGGATTVPLA